MKVSVSQKAYGDLDEMETWLCENWGPLAAANAIEAVLDKIAAIPEMPFAGTLRPEFGETTRFVTAGRYVIYYETHEQELVVLRILHAAQDRDGIMRAGD